MKTKVENMNANQVNAPTVEVGEANFEPEVLTAKEPVLVAFRAPWSQPCHSFEVALNQVAKTCKRRAKIVRINADDNPDLSLWYEIQSIPTLLYFVGGSIRAKLVGAANKKTILTKLRSLTQPA
jgi:thioredoxin-like negative regulator of GroEL